MHSWKTPLLALALAAAPLMGCEEEPAETETPETEEPETEEPEVEQQAEAEAEPAGPRVVQEGYTVELSGADGAVTSGELTQLALVIEGQGEWHLNQDFPFAVDIQAPDGVQLPKDSFGKDDAASFADEGARVDVPLTPTAAGEHTVEAEVRFAICNPQSCIPKTETVALALQVQ
ncbi:MAG: hypothetical protein JJ863_27645 [Deltaproteobacteria bacterium]|nr:hypothetical protein [Deltaproteobacteria bacterium]